MMQKLVKGALVGGLVLFVWGALNWMVFPWNKQSMLKFSDEERVARAIVDSAPQSGIYVLPNTMGLEKGSKAMVEAKENIRKGPVLFASVCLEGKNPNMGGSIAQGLILKIVAAFFVTWLVMQTKLSYKHRVGFITVVGLVVALLATVPYMIWFGFPMSFALGCMVESILGWFFAGLAIAKVCPK